MHPARNSHNAQISGFPMDNKRLFQFPFCRIFAYNIRKLFMRFDLNKNKCAFDHFSMITD